MCAKVCWRKTRLLFRVRSGTAFAHVRLFIQLVVRLVARLVVRSRLTHDCVRSIMPSIVAGHNWSHDWMRQVEAGHAISRPTILVAATVLRSHDRSCYLSCDHTTRRIAGRATIVRLFKTCVWFEIAATGFWTCSNTCFWSWDWPPRLAARCICDLLRFACLTGRT